MIIARLLVTPGSALLAKFASLANARLVKIAIPVRHLVTPVSVLRVKPVMSAKRLVTPGNVLRVNFAIRARLLVTPGSVLRVKPATRV